MIRIRPATPQDAEFMAPLVNQAGEGLPMATWTMLASEGQAPLEVGLDRIRGEVSWISHVHAWVAELDGRPAGCLVSYLHGSDMPGPDEDTPPAFVPLVELEALAPDSRYILIVSTLPQAQGKGVGRALLDHAEGLGDAMRMSLIVSNSNPGAQRLYERLGYEVVAARPIVPIAGWDPPGDTWQLMIKSLPQAGRNG